MRVGFVGLGRMGKPMARRLIEAGHDVVVFDTDAAAVETLTAAGAASAGSLATLADTVETVLLSLPTPPVVEQVILGAGGLASGGDAATLKTIVDLSTTGPSVTRAIAEGLEGRGVSLIDAPVSGGIAGAENGTLALMTSGDRTAFDSVEPLLQVFGSKIFYLGENPGSGQLMKVINNTLCATAFVSALEGLVVGAKNGLDTDTMLEVLNASSGQSFATSTKIPQCIADRSFPLRFTTNLIDKDVRLCLSEAERIGAPIPVGRMAQQILAMGIGSGFGEEDYAHVVELYEGWADTQVGSARTDEPAKS